MKCLTVALAILIVPPAFADEPSVLRGAGDAVMRLSSCREALDSNQFDDWKECYSTGHGWYEREAQETMRRYAVEKGLPEPDFSSARSIVAVEGLADERSGEATAKLRVQILDITSPCSHHSAGVQCKPTEWIKSRQYCSARNMCIDKVAGLRTLGNQSADRYEEKLAEWKTKYAAAPDQEGKSELKSAGMEVNISSLAELKDETVKQDSSLPFGPLDAATNSARYHSSSCNFLVAGLKGFDGYSAMWISTKTVGWKVGEFTKRTQGDNQYSDALTNCQARPVEKERNICLEILRAQGSYLGSGYVVLSAEDGKVIVVSSKQDETGIMDCLTQNDFGLPKSKVAATKPAAAAAGISASAAK